MKKIFGTLIFLAMFVIAYYYVQPSKTAEHIAADTLIVGTSADYPPYEKIDLTTGKIVGFDIDVITEIAQRLGKKIILKDMPFNSLMFNLAAGQIDLVAAGLSATENRKEAVLFSDVYLDEDYMVIVTQKNKLTIKNITDLYGKTVAVNTGYNADTYLSTMPEIKLIRLDCAADSALALQAHSVDAFATSKSSYTIFVEQQGTTDAYNYFTIPQTAEHCAFAFAKNNHQLKEQINETLAVIKQDGTLQKIKDSWGFHD